MNERMKDEEAIHPRDKPFPNQKILTKVGRDLTLAASQELSLSQLKREMDQDQSSDNNVWILTQKPLINKKDSSLPDVPENTWVKLIGIHDLVQNEHDYTVTVWGDPTNPNSRRRSKIDKFFLPDLPLDVEFDLLPLDDSE